ncbi:FAD-dependent oxidoreductase [Niveispirillum fermenti]|uniref:FAD-dependent oxidoreductase n=1 Tax=Niveispirillum fermenti TaxID=1233113 RepID=UPI003A852C4D
MSRQDLLIVGAGPAGMVAAIVARRHGLSVTVIDDQPAPGGQIWRSVEQTARRDAILGPTFTEGRPIAAQFRASGATYRAATQLWQIERGYRAFVSHAGQAEVIEADTVILATGAQERPVPFPGWTLPGVLTVGAAQILLKNAGQVPAGPLRIAGSGPLPLLYAVQLLQAGGRIASYLDTTPPGRWRAALRHLPGALHTPAALIKGLSWMAALRRAGVPVVRGATGIEAIGRTRVEAVRYRTRGGTIVTAPADTILVHEGVVPNIHLPLSLDCLMAWNEAQDCFAPVLDEWGESSQAGLFIAGDGAGIAGAKAACLRGELAALRVAVKAGRLATADAAAAAHRPRRQLDRERAVRPLLDSLFRPRPEIFAPSDDTIICRCEEVTAGEVRALCGMGMPGPNQIKAATRTGMGPCQGRQCGYTLTRLLAAAQGRPPGEVGFLHVRPPLKPVTLGELALLDRPPPP